MNISITTIISLFVLHLSGVIQGVEGIYKVTQKVAKVPCYPFIIQKETQTPTRPGFHSLKFLTKIDKLTNESCVHQLLIQEKGSTICIVASSPLAARYLLEREYYAVQFLKNYHKHLRPW